MAIRTLNSDIESIIMESNTIYVYDEGIDLVGAGFESPEQFEKIYGGKVSVDASAVDTSKAGKYTATITATDLWDNKTKKEISVNVSQSPFVGTWETYNAYNNEVTSTFVIKPDGSGTYNGSKFSWKSCTSIPSALFSVSADSTDDYEFRICISVGDGDFVFYAGMYRSNLTGYLY